MSTRTGALLIGSATLLMAIPFAWVAYAYEGSTGLVVFMAALVALLACAAAAVAAVARRASDG